METQGFSKAPWAKNPPVMQELRVRSPEGEDPLKEEMAIHSNIFAWELAWTKEPGWLQSIEMI